MLCHNKKYIIIHNGTCQLPDGIFPSVLWAVFPPVLCIKSCFYQHYAWDLSYNKHFKYCTDNNKDILRSLGTETITGLACCRHIATLLNDILQEKNIKSYTIPALIKKDSADISFLQSIIGNHLITISEYNDKVYYLDPTNNKFLTKDNSSIIINKKFIKFNLNKRRNIKRIMQKEEETYAKNLMEEISTHIICGENIDMFENFYSENKEKYEEINNKMKKLI